METRSKGKGKEIEKKLLEELEGAQDKTEESSEDEIGEPENLETEMNKEKKEIKTKTSKEEEEQDLKEMLIKMFQSMDENTKKLERSIKDNAKETEEKLKKSIKDIAKETEEKMDQKFKQFEEKWKDTKLELTNQINEKVEKLEERMEEKLEVHTQYIGNKIEEIEKNTENKINGLGKRVDNIKMENEQNIEQVKKEIEKDVTYLQVEYNKMREEDCKIITEVTEHIISENKKKETELKMLMEEIANKGTNYGQNSGAINLGTSGKTTIIFDGNIKKLHPKMFINTIKRKYKLIQKQIKNVGGSLSDYLRTHFKEKAMVWFNTKEGNIEDMDSFEEVFLKYFWGEHQQALTREKLHFGKFNPNYSSNMNEYALMIYNESQYLEPQMKEEELVTSIARHFGMDIAENILINNLKTMDQLSRYLRRIERAKRNNSGSHQDIRDTRTDKTQTLIHKT